MNDINRALLSANRAIQNAQEALQSRRSSSMNNSIPTQAVVDLTGNSPPSLSTNLPALRNAAYDAFLPPGPESLSGPQRRYHNQERVQRSQQRTSETGDDEAAIRRQSHARAQWAGHQRGTNDRLRLGEQRQRLLNSPTTSRASQTTTMDSQFSTYRPLSSSARSSSSIEAVDLAQVDDNPSLIAALSKQRQDVTTSQNVSSRNKTTFSGIGNGVGRTALTTYKCPICMEVPQNATTTSCGHLFCHKCIIDTLKWSEQARRDELPQSRNVKGVCPVCRKALARKEEPGHGRTLIPLEIKLVSKKELKRKREEEEQKARTSKKGKEKVYDIGDLFDDDEDNKVDLHELRGRSSSQKENSHMRRFKTLAEDRFNRSIDELFDFGADEEFA